MKSVQERPPHNLQFKLFEKITNFNPYFCLGALRGGEGPKTLTLLSQVVPDLVVICSVTVGSYDDAGKMD